jgi:hypothetical protein
MNRRFFGDYMAQIAVDPPIWCRKAEKVRISDILADREKLRFLRIFAPNF